MTKQCIHGHPMKELDIRGVPDSHIWICCICWQAEQDFWRLSTEEYENKYPEFKRIYPPAKVTLDEADKRQAN